MCINEFFAFVATARGRCIAPAQCCSYFGDNVLNQLFSFISEELNISELKNLRKVITQTRVKGLILKIVTGKPAALISARNFAFKQ